MKSNASTLGSYVLEDVDDVDDDDDDDDDEASNELLLVTKCA